MIKFELSRYPVRFSIACINLQSWIGGVLTTAESLNDRDAFVITGEKRRRSTSCWIHEAVWHLSKRRVVLPEDVSLAAPLKSDFLRLTPCQFSLCKRVARFRNHVGVRQAGLLHFQRVSSRFHGLFRPSFPGSRLVARVPHQRRDRTPTTFLRRLCLREDAVLAASDTFRRVASPLYLSSRVFPPSASLLSYLLLSLLPFLPSFRRVNFDTKNSSPLTRQTLNPRSIFSRQSDESAAVENL